MAQPYSQKLNALRGLITQAHAILDAIELAEDCAVRARELLTAAVALTDDLLAVQPAAALGARGGAKTAERGPDYFREIAAKRKTRAGGRPKKSAS